MDKDFSPRIELICAITVGTRAWPDHGNLHGEMCVREFAHAGILDTGYATRDLVLFIVSLEKSDYGRPRANQLLDGSRSPYRRFKLLTGI